MDSPTQLRALALLVALATACKPDGGATTETTTGGSTEPATTGTTTDAATTELGTTTASPTSTADPTGAPDPTDTADPPGTSTTGDSGDDSTTTTTGAVDIDATAVCLAMFEADLLYYTYVCECVIEKGWKPDLESCLPEYFASYYRRDCICGVHGEHAESEAYLQCVADAAEVRGACSQTITCDDFVFDPCDGAYKDTVDVCERHEYYAVEQDILATCGDDFFECDAGMEIPISWKCNGSPECDNGKDELDCP